MKSVGVAILGLGVVGSGTYKIIRDHREFYRRTQGIDLTVESVLEINRQRALDLGIEESKISDNIAEVVSNPNVDIVVEVIGGVEPAKSFVLAALHSGKSVVTSNKELFCKYWYELEAAAKRTNAGLYYEASCVGGVPIIRTLIDGMQANIVTSLTGIINGTTNYILTRMSREGLGYKEVLKDAQKLGYAEKIPPQTWRGSTPPISSPFCPAWRSTSAFRSKTCTARASPEFRSRISNTAGSSATYSNCSQSAKTTAETASKCACIPPLSARTIRLPPSTTVSTPSICRGTAWAISCSMAAARDMPTGSAIVSDVIYAATHSDVKYAAFKNTEHADKNTKFVSDFKSRYYIRLTVQDRVGILAKVAGIFSKYNISISDFLQKAEGVENIPIILITHMTSELSVRRAVEKIAALEDVLAVNSVIRVEG